VTAALRAAAAGVPGHGLAGPVPGGPAKSGKPGPKLDKDGYPVRDRDSTSIIATFEPASVSRPW